MVKIAINLLPSEFTSEKVKDTRFYKIQAVGVGLVLLVIFLSSVSVAMGILQSQRVKQAQSQLEGVEKKVVDYQDEQVSLLALKDRLTAINQYSGIPSLQVGLYNLLNTILPPSVIINSLEISRSGEIGISAIVQNSVLLDDLISSLVDKNKNQDKVNKVSIESLNRSKDGLYRVDLKVKPK